MGHYLSEMGAGPSGQQLERERQELAIRARGYTEVLRDTHYPVRFGHNYEHTVRACTDCGAAVADIDLHDRYCPARPPKSATL